MNGGLYDHELFTDERGEAVVFVPTDDPPVEGRVQPYVVPASELAVTLHHGPEDDIDITYARSEPTSPNTSWRSLDSARDLPRWTSRHRRRQRLAYRNRLADLPHNRFQLIKSFGQALRTVSEGRPALPRITIQLDA